MTINRSKHFFFLMAAFIKMILKFISYPIITAALGIGLWSCSDPRPNDPSEELKQLRLEFQNAWIRGDSAAVMNLMTEDVVFMPHHGAPMVKGIDELATYWFDPSYSPTEVVVFTCDFEGVEFSRDLGLTYGRFKLVYNYEGKNYKNEGNFLNVFKQIGGLWKFSQIIFNDPVVEQNDL